MALFLWDLISTFTQLYGHNPIGDGLDGMFY